MECVALINAVQSAIAVSPQTALERVQLLLSTDKDAVERAVDAQDARGKSALFYALFAKAVYEGGICNETYSLIRDFSTTAKQLRIDTVNAMLKDKDTWMERIKRDYANCELQQAAAGALLQANVRALCAKLGGKCPPLPTTQEGLEHVLDVIAPALVTRGVGRPQRAHTELHFKEYTFTSGRPMSLEDNNSAVRALVFKVAEKMLRTPSLKMCGENPVDIFFTTMDKVVNKCAKKYKGSSAWAVFDGLAREAQVLAHVYGLDVDDPGADLILQHASARVDESAPVDVHILRVGRAYSILDRSPTPKGLAWVDNSCYMDSVLMSLFYTPSFVSTVLLSPMQDDEAADSIRQRLVKMRTKLLSNENAHIYVNKLRREFSKLPKFEKYADDKCHDPIEFTTDLLNMFNVHTQQEKTIDTYNNDIRTSQEVSIDYNINVVLVLTVNDPNKFIHDQIIDSTVIQDNEGENKSWTRKEIKTVVNTQLPPCLIFAVSRRGGEYGGMKNVNIKFEETFGNFSLTAIVVIPKPGHYSLYFKSGGVWFYYDDFPTPITYRIGTLSNHGEYPDPSTKSTMFFYNKQD